MTRQAAAGWSNWSGIESCTPSLVVEPASVEELQTTVLDAARRARTVRVVGGGHSFTGAAVAPDVQVSLGRLSGLLDLDPARGRVEVEAGMRLHHLNRLLAGHGLAMENLGDIDRQTIAGAISTGTHGTGARLRGLAAQVVGLRLVQADGALVSCSLDREPDMVAAGRVSLGALGVITAVTLQCVPEFLLRAVEAPRPLDEVLAGLDELVDRHDHFEFYWFPHTARTLTKCNDRVGASEPRRPLPRWRYLLDDEALSNGLFSVTNRLCTRWPQLTPGVNQVAARVLGAREYVDASYKVFVSPRRVRFNESEYNVPRGSVSEVLRALRRWVDTHDVRIPFPVEVRFAAADDSWLSTAYERDSAYVAIHQYHRMDHRAYFDAFESIVADHGGRPHWGKLHSLDAARLRALYPRFGDFLALRDKVDAQRTFANPYVARVLGP